MASTPQINVISAQASATVNILAFVPTLKNSGGLFNISRRVLIRRIWALVEVGEGVGKKVLINSYHL
jgi:hypothetical protein